MRNDDAVEVLAELLAFYRQDRAESALLIARLEKRVESQGRALATAKEKVEELGATVRDQAGELEDACARDRDQKHLIQALELRLKAPVLPADDKAVHALKVENESLRQSNTNLDARLTVLEVWVERCERAENLLRGHMGWFRPGDDADQAVLRHKTREHFRALGEGV